MATSYFASRVIGDLSTMTEVLPPEWYDFMKARGGAGDELEYDAIRDRFGFYEGTGVSPIVWVDNPSPGDNLNGARFVAQLADAMWEKAA